VADIKAHRARLACCVTAMGEASLEDRSSHLLRNSISSLIRQSEGIKPSRSA